MERDDVGMLFNGEIVDLDGCGRKGMCDDIKFLGERALG